MGWEIEYLRERYVGFMFRHCLSTKTNSAWRRHKWDWGGEKNISEYVHIWREISVRRQVVGIIREEKLLYESGSPTQLSLFEKPFYSLIVLYSLNFISVLSFNFLLGIFWIVECVIDPETSRAKHLKVFGICEFGFWCKSTLKIILLLTFF